MSGKNHADIISRPYVGLTSAFIKLSQWIENNDFTDLWEADKQINWSAVKVVKLK